MHHQDLPVQDFTESLADMTQARALGRKKNGDTDRMVATLYNPVTVGSDAHMT